MRIKRLLRRRYRGDSIVFYALFTALIGVPAMALISDGVRLYNTREHLTMANDATCQTVAWFGGDRAGWREGGVEEIDLDVDIIDEAVATFNGILMAEAGRLRYQPSITDITYDPATVTVTCLAEARVDSFLPVITGRTFYTVRVISRAGVNFTIQ